MSKSIIKIISALIFWGAFIYIVLTIPYPESLTQANIMQIIPFFASLYFALLFTLNIFLRKIPISAFIALGIILLLFLKALNSLNLVTGLLIIISIGLFSSYFKKGEIHGPSKNSGFRNLTKSSKIPKLTKL